MTQSTLNRSTHPLGTPKPAYKVGETGDTVVYIFPSGNACVKKGEKSTTQKSTTQAKSVAKTAPQAPATPQAPSPPKPTVRSKPSGSRPQSIGDRLIQSGLITVNQLQVALYDQQSMNLDLGEVLIARGWLDEVTFNSFLSA